MNGAAHQLLVAPSRMIAGDLTDVAAAAAFVLSVRCVQRLLAPYRKENAAVPAPPGVSG